MPLFQNDVSSTVISQLHEDQDYEGPTDTKHLSRRFT